MEATCWSTIGVWGRSEPRCAELARVTHCRNCPVFVTAGRSLLDRQPPAGYGASWIDEMHDALARERQVTVPVLVFRLGEELLAWPLQAAREVVAWRPIRSVPHRRDDLLLGLANVDGELRLCVSLEVLFGGQRTDVLSSRPRGRLLVAGDDGATWALPVHEVFSMHLAPQDALEQPPATVSRSSQAFLRGLLPWRDERVGLLDPELVLSAIGRRLL